jgi:3-deoxy-D-manno-octulosonate 8-phosphate phosphatase (KDO 8-P phosphatase)
VPRTSRARAAAAWPAIRLLVLDVDGVLTDGRLWFGARGEVMKAFHVRDGHGIRELLAAGVEIAVISGRRSAAVARRCRELGIRRVHQGIDDKLAALERICSELGIEPGRCACVGDDGPDLPLMRAVGLAFAVADAHPAALAAAQIVTRAAGGTGAVREVCDELLRRMAVPA